MRILYIINAFARGGAEILTCGLAASLAAQGETVAVAALYPRGDGTEAAMRASLHARGIQTFLLGKSAGRRRVAALRALCRAARSVRAQVLHGHCSVPMLYGKLAGALLGLPVVCTVHNTAGYPAGRERRTAFLTRRYVAISAAAERYMTGTLSLPAEKIRRIYNAVPAPRAETARRSEAFRRALGCGAGDTLLVGVGRVTEQKNPLCLLRALKLCRDRGWRCFRLVWLGRAEDGALFRSLERYAAEHGLADMVCFPGEVENVPEYLANGDLFVMTSRYEGLSVAFLEAVMSGLPVLTTDMPFVEEMNAVAPCAETVPQDDAEALAARLMEGGFRRPSGETVRAFRERFSMETCAVRHRALYRTLLEEDREGRT